MLLTLLSSQGLRGYTFTRILAPKKFFSECTTNFQKAFAQTRATSANLDLFAAGRSEIAVLDSELDHQRNP